MTHKHVKIKSYICAHAWALDSFIYMAWRMEGDVVMGNPVDGRGNRLQGKKQSTKHDQRFLFSLDVNVDICMLTQLQLHPIFSNLSFFWTTYVVKSQGVQNVAIIPDFPVNSSGKHFLAVITPIWLNNKPMMAGQLNSQHHQTGQDPYLLQSYFPALSPSSVLNPSLLLIQKSHHLQLNFPWPLTNKGSHTNLKP